MRTTSLTCSFALGALMIGFAGTAAADDHGFYADVGAGAALGEPALTARRRLVSILSGFVLGQVYLAEDDRVR